MGEPLIEVRFENARTEWRAGEELSGVAHLTSSDGDTVGAVEVSVLWVTDGKGSADTQVIWFESFGGGAEQERTLPFRARLPLLPLTYRGELIRISWLVRVRRLGFMGNDTVVDAGFVVH